MYSFSIYLSLVGLIFIYLPSLRTGILVLFIYELLICAHFFFFQEHNKVVQQGFSVFPG